MDFIPCIHCKKKIIKDSDNKYNMCNKCKSLFIPNELQYIIHEPKQNNFNTHLIKPLEFIFIYDKFYHFSYWLCNECHSPFVRRTSAVSISKNPQKCEKCSIHDKSLFSHTRLFRIWNQLKAKTNPNMSNNSPYWLKYGSKKISLYKPWNDFKTFAYWSLDNNYNDYYVLYREPESEDFSPTSCKWIFPKEYQYKQMKPKGVKKIKNKYIAQISVNNRIKHIGSYDTLQEAALAYDEYVIRYNLKRDLNYR